MPEPTEPGNSSLGIVPGFSPETEIAKPFQYYTHELEEESEIWDEMVRELVPDGSREITGVFYKDGTIIWSNDAVPHRLLKELTNKPGTEEAGVFQSKYREYDKQPTLQVFSDNDTAVDKFEGYLQRSISPETPVLVMVHPMDFTKAVVSARFLEVGTV